MSKQVRLYRLVDKENNELFLGTLEECKEHEYDRIEFAGVFEPVYRATFDDGRFEVGTIAQLSKKLGLSYLNLYNYTRYHRKSDGLYLTKEK